MRASPVAAVQPPLARFIRQSSVGCPLMLLGRRATHIHFTAIAATLCSPQGTPNSDRFYCTYLPRYLRHPVRRTQCKSRKKHTVFSCCIPLALAERALHCSMPPARTTDGEPSRGAADGRRPVRGSGTGTTPSPGADGPYYCHRSRVPRSPADVIQPRMRTQRSTSGRDTSTSDIT